MALKHLSATDARARHLDGAVLIDAVGDKKQAGSWPGSVAAGPQPPLGAIPVSRFQVRKVAVLGAGVMGAQIAAHLANVGIPVLLMDIVPTELAPEEQQRGLNLRDPAVRNRITRGLFDRMRKLSPAPFFTPEAAGLVRIGNVEDDLPEIADADWVIEAVLERMMADEDFARRVLEDANGALAGSGLGAEDMAALASMTRADFTQFASATPEERKSFGHTGQHNETFVRTA